MNDELIDKVFDSKNCGKFKVVKFIEKKHSCSRYLVRFLDTNFETLAYKTNIIEGRVLDKTLENPLRKYKKGQILIGETGKHGEVLELIEMPRKTVSKNGANYRLYVKIKMLDTGYITICDPYCFKKGKVKDYLEPTVLGVGMLGYIEHLEEQGKLGDMKEYRVWEGMIRRCYQKGYDYNKSYKDVKVCDRWLRFDYFYEDIVNVEGYDLWKEYREKYPNKKNIYEFDKDTRVIGNKIYSLETCRFIPKTLNAGFTSLASQETKNKLLSRLEVMQNESGNERCFSEECYGLRTIYNNRQGNCKPIRWFKEYTSKNIMVNVYRWFIV